MSQIGSLFERVWEVVGIFLSENTAVVACSPLVSLLVVVQSFLSFLAVEVEIYLFVVVVPPQAVVLGVGPRPLTVFSQE